jgi:hypothetical protein
MSQIATFNVIDKFSVHVEGNQRHRHLVEDLLDDA